MSIINFFKSLLMPSSKKEAQVNVQATKPVNEKEHAEQVKQKEKRLLVDEHIERFVNDMLQEKDVDNEIEMLAPVLSLKQMERAVDIFFLKSTGLFQQKEDICSMNVVLKLCIARGEDICPYLDRTAFGEYDWTQRDAIEILCRMALAKGIRKQRTLELIFENLGSFRYETFMPCIQYLSWFENEPRVAEIFKSNLQHYKDNYSEFLNILKHCVWNYPEIVREYSTLLKSIILESGEDDYSLFEMSYIMSSKDGGEMKAYDKDGNEYTADEGIEANKLTAAGIYITIDKNDAEINAFVEKVAADSKFENHRQYAESILRPKN